MPCVNQIEVAVYTSLELFRSSIKIVSSQLHPFLQQTEIVKYCNENNIVVQAYCPIIRGQMDDPTITALATKVRILTKDVHFN
jgi:diketogulonate reductase-like aldo/keto reductase